MKFWFFRNTMLLQRFRFSIDLILVRELTLYTFSRSTPYIVIERPDSITRCARKPSESRPWKYATHVWIPLLMQLTLTDKTINKNCTNGKLSKGKLFVSVLLKNIKSRVDWHQIDGEKAIHVSSRVFNVSPVEKILLSSCLLMIEKWLININNITKHY